MYKKRRANFVGTKNCGGEKSSGESEGGQKFLPPPTPFLFARPSVQFGARSAAIIRDFVQNEF